MGSAGTLVFACLGTLIAGAASMVTPYSHFHLAGDYILGGLFRLHNEDPNRSYLSRSQVHDCKKYTTRPTGYSLLQAMRYAVEEINNSSVLLPGVSLGYEMVDICYLTSPIHPLLYFLSDDRSVVEIRANYTFYQPRVLAVIGPDTSAATVISAHILSQFLVPQISYSATTELLSNTRIFPASFRTIPSTEQQISIILKLLKSFDWQWVIVLHSEDEYGNQNFNQLRVMATWPCIAFQGSIPVVERDDRPDLISDAEEEIRAIVAKIKESSAKVVVVLSTDTPLSAFFREVIRQNVTGLVWIATETWTMDPVIRNISGISRIGTIIGVAPEEVPIPGLSDFRLRLSPDGLKSRAGPETCNQECDDCFSMTQTLERYLQRIGNRIDFNVYSAVYTAANALHQLLGCNASGCHQRTIYPWQLRNEMTRVNFTLLNVTISFDDKGDPVNGFEVVQWLWGTPRKYYRRIAGYGEDDHQVYVDPGSIKWHTENNTVPKSVCSERCRPGQRIRHLGAISCCFKCEDCEPGTFLNQSNVFHCQSCPPNMWSNVGQEECFLRSLIYLRLDNPAAIILLFFIVLGFLAAWGILFTFVRHAKTPVVKSAGGPLCFLMSASLIIGFLSLLLYFGQPTEFKCVARRTVFSLCFTLCVACMTVRSFQIVCVFKMAAWLPTAYNAWVKYNGQWVFISTIFTIKVGILVLNLYLFSPFPLQSVASRSDPAVSFFNCNANYHSAVVVNNLLEMVLSFACFSLAYVGKELPKNYNEVKYITLCMTNYFTCWVILFVVMSLLEGTVVTIFNVGAALCNLLSITLGYFGPKCYVIFFHPERNTAAFFQAAIQSYTMKQG